MKVLTLNCWGLYFEAKHVKERFKYIAREAKHYDIVCFQEIWDREDYDGFVDRLSDSLPYSHHFISSSFMGSGLCIFSKYPITSVITHQYRVTGGMRVVADGEVFAGKGVLCCKLQSPQGTLIVCNTHLNPRCRDTQLFELMQLVRNIRGVDPVIICGDFNTKDKYPAYRLMTDCLNLHDAYSDEPSVMTCDRSDNIYTKRDKIGDDKRVDFIFHSDHLLLQSRRLVMTGLIPGEQFPYSDHEGVEAVFTMSSCNQDSLKGNDKINANGIKTLETISDQIKLKRSRHFKSGTIREGFQFIALLVLFSVAISLLMVWLIGRYPQYHLHWFAVPLSFLGGVCTVLFFFGALNDNHIHAGLSANIHEIDTILKYQKTQMAD